MSADTTLPEGEGCCPKPSAYRCQRTPPNISPVAQPLGPTTISANFAQDAYYLASSTTQDVIIYAFPTKGAFTIRPAMPIDEHADTGRVDGQQVIQELSAPGSEPDHEHRPKRHLAGRDS